MSHGKIIFPYYSHHSRQGITKDDNELKISGQQWNAYYQIVISDSK